MPAALVALPPRIITDTAEVAPQLKAAASDYLKKQLQSLQLSTPTQTIKNGGFRGTEIYSWNFDYEGILQTVFIVDGGKVQTKEFVKLTVLVRRDDCMHLGSSWEFSGTALRGNPEVSRPTNIADIARRTPSQVSTVRLDSSFIGPRAERFSTLYDAIVAEEYASKATPVNSFASRLACKWNENGTKLKAPLQTYPARSHRVLVSRLVLEGAPGTWPQAKGNALLHNGVFGEAARPVFEVKQFELFAPTELLKKIVAVSNAVSHDLRQDTFRILKRKGRWVYLDRGRAYGLEIGAHLTGPDGAALHVIQFTGSEADSPDVAVAYIRKEDAARPLKQGDALTFDNTVYPVGAKP